MDLKLWDENNIQDLSWDDSENHHLIRSLILPMMTSPANKFISNANAEVKLVQFGQKLVSLTLNQDHWENCYTVAPFGVINYSKDELRHLKPLERVCAKGLIAPVAWALKSARVNHTICVNNYLLSTNLYSDLDALEMDEITKYLTKKYPKYAIMWRSLNDHQHADLIAPLKKWGYCLAASRRVWIFKRPSERAISKRIKKTLREDAKLRKNTPFTLRHIEPSEVHLIPRIKDLYDELYLKKYSYHNPRFTQKFIEMFMDSPKTKMAGIFEGQVLQGVIGCYMCNGTITTPLVGYNGQKPQSDGLYRLLTALTMEIADTEELLLNHSSGAGHFKRGRGAIGCYEYSAVYVKHLSVYQKFVWQTLSSILNTVGVYFLEKYRL